MVKVTKFYKGQYRHANNQRGEREKRKPVLQFFKFGGSSFSSNYWAQSLLIRQIMTMMIAIAMRMMITMTMLMTMTMTETCSLWLALPT